MKDWKTTAFSIIAAAAGFVLFQPQYFPPVVKDLAAYIFAGGLAGLGIVAGDVKQQPKQ